MKNRHPEKCVRQGGALSERRSLRAPVLPEATALVDDRDLHRQGPTTHGASEPLLAEEPRNGTKDSFEHGASPFRRVCRDEVSRQATVYIYYTPFAPGVNTQSF